MVRIEILAGPEAGRVVDFGPGTWRAGRLKDNDLVLPVDSVSGHHLEFTVAADGTIRFRDLGSTNGTFSAGAQVQEGEWFGGSELRLGACALRLLASGESGMLEAAAAEGRDAARAREAALSARRSRAPMLIGGVLLLAAAGAASWWFLFRDGGAAPSGRGPQENAAAGVEIVSDAIDGLGDFADAEAWSAGEGVALRDGALSVSGARGRAVLLRTFALEGGGLRLSAETAGVRARALITFGADEAGSEELAAWQSGDLGSGAELALPEGARWFKLALALEGSGTIRNLRADAIERAAAPAPVPPGQWFQEGGNLLILSQGIASQGRPVLAAQAAAGEWTRDDGGCSWSGPEGLALAPGPALTEEGPILILAAGGPVAAASGVRIEQSPGLLIGGPLRRLLASHEPATWTAADGGLRSDDVRALRIAWDLAPALTEVARIGREIQTATRDQDDARMLAAAARLLRDFPLDDERNAAALAAQRAALERGRARLDELQADVGGALFVGAIDAMEPLAQQAEQLAATYAGTPLGSLAQGLGEALRGAVEAGRSAEREREDAWRVRLIAALRGAYPVIANWAEAQPRGEG